MELGEIRGGGFSVRFEEEEEKETREKRKRKSND